MIFSVCLLALLSIAPSAILAANCPGKAFFAVAQRDLAAKEEAGGIFLVSFSEGSLKKDLVLTSELAGERPSYVAVTSGTIYSTNADEPGELRRTRFTSRMPFVQNKIGISAGSRSTHVSVLGKIIAVANFGGSVATFRSSRQGLKLTDEFTVPVSLASKLKNDSLSGVFATPHPHMAFPYKRGILVPDLGSDLLWYFSVRRGTGKLKEISRTALRIGDGPRHVVLHPKTNTIYLVNQVSLTVVVLREGSCGSGQINECDRRPLLDAGTAQEDLSAAAIRVSKDGRFLYASVRWRGDVFGRIVGYELNSKTGDIVRKIGEWSSCGAHPRDFAIVEGVLYMGKCTSFVAVANRDSSNVVLLKRNVQTGALSGGCDAISTSIVGAISIVNYA